MKADTRVAKMPSDKQVDYWMLANWKDRVACHRQCSDSRHDHWPHSMWSQDCVVNAGCPVPANECPVRYLSPKYLRVWVRVHRRVDDGNPCQNFDCVVICKERKEKENAD